MTWLLFLLLALVIVGAGSALTKRADAIAEHTGAGRTWIGLVLLAATTSLPELFTGTGSVTLYDAPDIAVGDVLGSNMFNVLLLVLIDGLGRGPLFLAHLRRSYVKAIQFGAALLALVLLGLLARQWLPAIGWMGPTTLAILPVYLWAMRSLHRTGQAEQRDVETAVLVSELALAGAAPPLRRVYVEYAIGAAAVVSAALYLPGVGAALAVETGLGQTFIGSLLVALTTSLPELAVTVASLRIGRTDLALGNILGSNLFNLAILSWDDALYTRGPLLSAISHSNLVTVLANFAMYVVLALWIVLPKSRRRWAGLSPGSWAIICIYAVFAASM